MKRMMLLTLLAFAVIAGCALRGMATSESD
jgi:hypothetical protein